jgi:signal transduction histidine kinase
MKMTEPATTTARATMTAEPLRGLASIAIAVGAGTYVLLALFFAFAAVAIDAAREPPAFGSESEPVGLTGSWMVDFATLRIPDDLFDPAVRVRFQPAGGSLPVSGMQYFRDGAMWLRFTVPEIASPDGERTIRVSDPRVRRAWLVWRDGERIEMREWAFDDPERRAGLGSRTPAFHFRAGEMEGREVFVGFVSLSVLRGAVSYESRRAYQSWELRQTVLPTLLGGALLAIGVYLCIIGLAMREAHIVAAGAMSFALCGTLFGGPGLFHAYVLPAYPSLADFVAYLPRLLPLTAWLAFLIIYLRLRQHAPRIALLLAAVAIVAPFQGIVGALKVGFGWHVPIAVTSGIPALIGLATGLAVVSIFAVRGMRRARVFLLCWLPMLLGMGFRSIAILFPNPATAQFLAQDPFIDVVASMVALSVVIVVDMQGRERALRQRAEADERRLREFSQIASHSFFEADADGVVLSAAGPVASELGLVAGSQLLDVAAGLDAAGPGLAEELAQARQARRGFRDVEFFMRTPGGRQRWYAFNVEPWEDGSGGHGLRGTIEEVTARVERRSQIAQQGKLAAMGQLAGGIAHEVNNLLHPVINLARRVRDRHVSDREGRRLLDLVIDSGKRAGEVVEGVLESVSTTRRRGALIPLSMAVERAVAASMAALPPHVRFVTAIEPVAEPAVALGPMLQVIGNLVQNAAQAIGDDGEIVVMLASVRDGMAELSVRDDGRGMSEDLRRSALQPFVTARAEGTGLGLSAVASIVAGWNGTIELLSREGEGTTVIIRIPQAVGNVEI